MTRYFLDTEFLEDGRTIELISVGIVAEDGREYYAETMRSHMVGGDLHSRILQHEWLMANVVPHLDRWPYSLGAGEVASPVRPQAQIREEIATFITGKPEFWAFCGAYDWVVLNQLFGSMVDHPRKWPFYCNDVAQLALHLGVNRRKLPPQESTEHHALADARWTRDSYLWLMAKDRERRLDGRGLG